jgi:aspartate kinase
MARIVQKYGGTSVGDLDRIRNVASRVKKVVDEGHQVIVVVSARSGVTNELIAKARSLNPQPNDREMDMLLAIGEQETIALLAMAIHALGLPAVSRTGAQAGIMTDLAHTRARIVSIAAGSIEQCLDKGEVVIVAGFQGITSDGQITTLGRGGSDLSAIAMASALKADLCQIFTDVDGVYTADPRIVPDARKLNEISYEEMLELASLGSKVMQARSVEFAKKYGVLFEVRSSFNDNPGTIVKEEVASMEDVVVRGVAVDKNQVKVTISNLPDKPGTAAEIFKALSDAKVVVDMIIQNVGRGGVANLTFTVPRDDAERSAKAVNAVLRQFGGGQLAVVAEIAKLSVVGVGMRTHSGVATTLFQTLARHDINIQMISTSEIKISVVLDLARADEAARVVHAAFKLEQE